MERTQSNCIFHFYFHFCQTLGSVAEDADSDEEWPTVGEAGAMGDDAECDTEVTVDPEDEKAIEIFMNKNPPMRQWTTQSQLYCKIITVLCEHVF